MTNKEAIEQLKQIPINPEVSDEYMETIYQAIDIAIKTLEERPKGEWYYSIEKGWHCSECDEVVKDMPTCMRKASYNFCPNCGADMRGERK